MTERFCTYCRTEITDDRRLRRGIPYCSPECRRHAKNERRNRDAGEKCRLCGRKFRRNTTTSTPSEARENSTVATVAQPIEGIQ
jgi:transposase-like protein